jgi:iron-sulfur cluster repair protein YtfE (RIC family)
MTSKPTFSFSAVLAEHSELEALFAKHQRCLLVRDVPAAVTTLKTFEHELDRHITFEDQVLLPLYASKGAEVEGATLPIFHAEHRKLQQMAAKLVRETGALDGSPDLLGSILQLLDDEVLFKGLFAHHGLREENLLFPGLDASTTEAEREKVLRRA